MGYKVAVIAGPGVDTTSACGALEKAGHEVLALVCDESLTQRLRSERPDVCLPTFAGTDGRSGAVPSLLELLCLSYVGSPSSSCRSLSRPGELETLLELAVHYADSTAHSPRTICLESRCLERMGAQEALDIVARDLPGGYPLDVVSGQASAYRTVATDEELAEAAVDACSLGPTVAFRQWVEGVHVAVGVLGDADDLQVLPAVEIVRGERVVLDEELGLGDTTTDYFAPVRLDSLDADPAQAQIMRSDIERTALDAYLACGCRDIAVVNMVWDGARALVLDVDPTPALGPADIVPLSCEAAQIPLDEVLGALVEIAAERGC